MSSTARALRIAGRIFAQELGPGKGSKEGSAALEASRLKLSGVISPYFGSTGFDALFERSVRRVGGLFPCLSELAAQSSGTVVAFLDRVLRRQEFALVHEIALALLSCFFDVLALLVGEDLAAMMFHAAWPEALADETSRGSQA